MLVDGTQPLDARALEALGEEIATFAVRVDVAEHALLRKLQVFDAHEAWYPAGFLSCAQWLSWRAGIGPTAARERVRVARALPELPKVDALFGRGELSYSKVRAITRVATPATEQDFIDVALHATAAQLERPTRSYARCVEIDVASRAPTGSLRASQRRYVRRSETRSGMVRIEIQLAPEDAAVVWDAIESAWDGADGGRDVSAGTSSPSSTPSDLDPSGVSLATGSTPTAPDVSAGTSSPNSTPTSAVDARAEPPPEQRRADALVDLARAYLEHRPRSRGSGYELVLLSSREQLADGPGCVGGFLRDGTPVPLAVARMLACDAGRVDVTVDEHGELLDVGRRTRSIPAAIGRALWLRDGGCRVPGCGRRRHLHGHHIVGWADGGPTKLDNLVLLCHAHHRRIHEGALHVGLDAAGALEFRTATGLKLSQAPARPVSGCELDELDRLFADADLVLDPSLNFPRWDGRRMDLQDSLTWMLMAHGH